MGLYNKMQKIVVWKAWGIPNISKNAIGVWNKGVLVDEQRGVHFKGIWNTFNGAQQWEHAPIHLTSGVCNSKHCCNCKAYA